MRELFSFEDNFTDEEKLIRNEVKKFVNEKVMPTIENSFEKSEFLPEYQQGLADLGIFGLTLPEKYGCANASEVAYGLVCQELERADSGLRSFASVQSSLCMYPIYAYGSDAQKEKYLPHMAQGKLIGCFGLTEPNSGSDPASMQTTAKKVQDGYILNGAKMWITNATIANIAIVWAKLDSAKDKDKVRGFIIDTKSKGFRTNLIKNKLSLRASITGELVMQDCFVPEDSLLPGSDIGLKAPLGCLTKARYGIAWGVMGAAKECFDIALNYTLDRKQFGKSLAAFQLVQKDLVDMYNEIIKTQALNLHLGRLHAKGQANYAQVSMAKMNACQQALNIARKARNLLGANGVSLEYHVIRHMANLESVFTYEGTDNMHHLIVGRYLTGLSAFG